MFTRIAMLMLVAGLALPIATLTRPGNADPRSSSAVAAKGKHRKQNGQIGTRWNARFGPGGMAATCQEIGSTRTAPLESVPSVTIRPTPPACSGSLSSWTSAT
jgi:hypothetical protein